jgi:aminoglycoside phosphotransferase (APT) family kinase protein
MQSHAQKLETAMLVGKGFCSDVYDWGEGRVLKLYHSRFARGPAEREYAATRAVHAAGLPAPAALELMEVSGRYGIVFERVEGVSLLGYTQARPWSIFTAVRLLADLHARIHGWRAPAELPTLRERIAARIAAATGVTEAQRQTALRRLAGLPDGTALCHGDFHPGNVLITPRGPVIIDWSSASRGDPLGDVACTSRLVRTARLPSWAPGYMHVLLRCLRTAIHRSYLKRYLQTNAVARRQLKAWEAPLLVAAKAWPIPTLTAERTENRAARTEENRGDGESR